MNEHTSARSDPRRDVVAWLNSGQIEAEMKRALPDHLPVDWFLRCAQTSLLNNPNLAGADKSSLLRELVAVAQLGLVLDPQLGEAWLIIDRHGKVQRRVGYQGLRKLALQSGMVTGLNAQAVYRADTCEITLGDSPSVRHTVNLEVGDRGAIIGYYAVGKVVGTSEPVVEWMSSRQVEEHRDRYSDAFKGRSGPWSDPLGAVEMARKTVFRRMAKWLPKSPLLADALSHEDRQDMRDVTPGPDQAVLPAPSDDPMDEIVAAQSRQDAPGRAPASSGPTIPPQQSSAPERAGPPTERAKPRGRPKKPETIARDIIAEIGTTAPHDVQATMQDHAVALAALPDELRTEVTAAAMDREAQGEGDDDQPAGEPADYDPETGEVVDERDSDPNELFAAWVAGMRHAISNEKPEFLLGTKNRYLVAARLMDDADDAAAAVESAYAARTRGAER